ncbi:MAG: cytidylate kinase family protein [Candidatus Methylomirabilales bacterium]
MAIIAMTKEMGSLGTYIGIEVAKRLGYEFVRQDIIRQAAREFEVSEEALVRAVEERPGFFERLGQGARRQLIFVAAEVFGFAERGNAVIMGRFSTLLLRPVSHVPTIRVCAPLEVRVRRVMERHATPRAPALRMIKAYEDGVRARVEQFFEVDWRDPLQYDLTVNTERLSLEAGTEQVLRLAERPEFTPTDASRRTLVDLHLAARVRAVLKAQPETARLDVDVRAEAGRVMLAGTVASAAEREAAERVARGLAGVQDVTNRLVATVVPLR